MLTNDLCTFVIHAVVMKLNLHVSTSVAVHVFLQKTIYHIFVIKRYSKINCAGVRQQTEVTTFNGKDPE